MAADSRWSDTSEDRANVSAGVQANGSSSISSNDSRPTSKERTIEQSRSKEQETYKHIAQYAQPDDKMAFLIVLQTLGIYASLFATAAFYNGPYLYLVRGVCLVLCGCTRTRVFIVMHDMAHHSFFSNREANVVGAVLLGALVYTPYSGWKKGHDYHHRHSNKTDRKQWAQTAPLTIKQFKALPYWKRVAYRFIYGHWTLCTTTPWLYFVVIQRLMSKWYENALIFLYWVWIFGSGNAWLVATDMLTAAMGSALGLFLFHIQHTFEGAYKAPDSEYSRYVNGMQGSSYLIVPWWLKFFTAAIEYHNVHHLNTRVPLYRLQKCFEDGQHLFEGVPTFTMLQAFRRLPYSLRHDDEPTFVSCYRH